LQPDLSIPQAEAPPRPAPRGEERVWEEDLEILTPHYGIEDVPPLPETLLYAGLGAALGGARGS